MHRSRPLFFLMVFLLFLFPALSVAAQDTLPPAPSAGCTALENVTQPANPSYDFVSYEFYEGDTVRVALSGTGTEFALLESGSVVVGPVPSGNSLTYIIPATGDYLFSVEVTGSAADTEIDVSCTPSDTVIEEPVNDGTICHIPPGNAAAAHTINVGLPAVSAHLGHGDTLGACPPGVETRYDNFGAGVAVYILYKTGSITIYNNCTGECSTAVTFPAIIIINLNTIIHVDNIFIDLGEPTEVDYDEDDDEGDYEDNDGDGHDDSDVKVFYLHPHPGNGRIGVFQINIYKNDTLIDDSILLFIDLDGDILLWTTHSYWFDNQALIVLED